MEQDDILTWLLEDIARFSAAVWPDKALRPYQVPPARAIVTAVERRDGATIAVVFSRQAGKDEALAQVLAFLLIRYQFEGGEIVVALPSLVPQGQISRQRLLDRLEEARPFVSAVDEAGMVVRVGKASVRYMSASPTAQARGATASLLLVANESQDIEPDIWDARFEPMGASVNSPTVYLGTVWTAMTLLARAMAIAKQAGLLFLADWVEVAKSIPAYGARVRARIAALGENHPFVRTEYRLLPLDGDGLLFTAARQAQMRGAHPRQHTPTVGCTYAFLVDVAGEDEERTGSIHHAASETQRRDSTVLTIVEIGASAIAPAPGTTPLPIYRVIDRQTWIGANHTALAATIVDLARRVWRPARVVVDATGIGHGLSAMLRAALGEQAVLPFVFNATTKSDLGWKFIAAIETGRYQEYADDQAQDTRLFWQQVAACAFTVQSGPGKLMHWSVPSPTLHDDLLLSAALCAALDEIDLRPRIAVGTVPNLP